MSDIKPKPLDEQERFRITQIAESYPTADYAQSLAHVLWLEQREAHVIDVLRDAERNNGGYGFVRDILRYLGADQEVQG